MRRGGAAARLAARVWRVMDPAALLREIGEDGERPDGWTASGAERFREGLHLRLECDGALVLVMDMNLRRGITMEEFARTVPAREYVTGVLEQALPGEFDRPGPGPGSALVIQDAGPEGRIDMSEWPMTPGPERMQRAERALEEEAEAGPNGPGPAPVEDVEAMREILMTGLFERAASSALNERSAAAASPLGVAQILGWQADTPGTIGIVLARQHDQEGMRMFQISISRLLRSPDWMGVCTLLSLVRDTSAIVMESRELPGRPGMVVLTTAGADPPEDDRPVLPDGEAGLLRDLLRWHGVRDCIWMPSTERPGP